MHLADPELIASLITTKAPRRRATLRGDNPNLRYSASGPRKRRCQCRACGTCQENERWERIFNEKFADPDYYGAASVRMGSALHEIG